MSTTKVYVLQNGEYSDAHVVGVYSTKEKADIATKVYDDCPFIDEFEIDVGVEAIQQGMRIYDVSIGLQSGDVNRASQCSYLSAVTAEELRGEVVYTDPMVVYCWARNVEHAVKIAADRRRVFLATRRES